jgi:DedD protein
MAKELSPEQIEIRRKGRQRLIGAIMLVLLLVVFVPMLLDPEPRQQRPEPVLAIPPKQSPPPLPAPSRPAPAAPQSSPPAVGVPASPATPESPGKAPPAVAAPAPVVKGNAPAAKAAPPESKTAGVPRLEGFAVQVGAFKDEAKLAQAREKLAAARISHYIERLTTGSGELTRLRAGPFPTREAAEKAAADVTRAGLEGQVVPLP